MKYINISTTSVKEEKELMMLSEEEGWVSIGSHAKQRDFWKHVAENTITGQRKRISIAVNQDDLARLKSEALRTNIPYQTIVNNLIRKHVRPR